MLALNATTLLAAWEQGASQHPLRRSLSLLALACPEKSVDEWASVSVGERDRKLLQLRDELFGSKLEAIAGCPSCGATLELAFCTADLETSTEITSASRGRLTLTTGDYEVGYRLPTSADLMEVSHNPGRGTELLLERCVDARRNGVGVNVIELPADIVEAVGEEMARADPQADIQMAMDCPACSHHWSAAFDVISYVWSEIEDWAERLIQEVHSLASAYGWSESDIVSMTARRRRLYLEKLGGAPV